MSASFPDGHSTHGCRWWHEKMRIPQGTPQPGSHIPTEYHSCSHAEVPLQWEYQPPSDGR